MVVPNTTLRKSAVQPTPFQSRAQLQPTATDTGATSGTAARPSTADLLGAHVAGAGGLPVQTGLPTSTAPSVARPALHITPLYVSPDNPDSPYYPGGHHGDTPNAPPSGGPGAGGVSDPINGQPGYGSPSPAQPGGHPGAGGQPPAHGPVSSGPSLPSAPTIGAPQSTLYNAADLGQQYLADYDQANAQAEQNMYRQAGQYNAALGRLGSGMTEDDLNNITRNIANDRLNFAYNAGQQERNYLTGRQDADRTYGLQQAGVSDQLANSNWMRALQKAQFQVAGPNNTAAIESALQAAQNAQAAQAGTGDLLSLYALSQPPRPTTPYPPASTAGSGYGGY